MGESTPDVAKRGKYGVRLVRGPFVQLPPHPEECSEDGFLEHAERLRADGYLLQTSRQTPREEECRRR